MTSEETPVAGTGVSWRTERHGRHVDLALGGDLDDLVALDAVTDAVRAQAGPDGPSSLRLIADHPADRTHPLPEAVADALGLHQRRELLQLRRPLPIDADDPLRRTPPPLRPFDPARDAGAWVRTNNRAFASHPDQGAETETSLAATLAEPWVDLEGFQVLDDAERPGELAGSCWTRIHPPAHGDPALGEIFVIGVDPAHHGRGLGTDLVLAGLDHLASRGIDVGMLYVESDNASARALYDKLGFATHLRRRIASAGAS